MRSLCVKREGRIRGYSHTPHGAGVHKELSKSMFIPSFLVVESHPSPPVLQLTASRHVLCSFCGDACDHICDHLCNVNCIHDTYTWAYMYTNCQVCV